MNRLTSIAWAMLILTGFFTSCYAQTAFTQPCTNPKFPSSGQTLADESCSPTGNGGKERSQNLTKNNFCAPLGPQSQPVLPISFQTLLNLQTSVSHDPSINFGDSPSDNPGPTVNRTKLHQIGEGRLVSLIGYVQIARQEGAESVNCGKNVPNAAVRHDIHISLVPTRQEQNECHCVVVEMSPHHRPADWTAAAVNRLKNVSVPVRVTGQLMFDSSHLPCQNDAGVRTNPKRFSLWEIHPIYKFEVCTSNCSPLAQPVWTDLSEWLKSTGVE